MMKSEYDNLISLMASDMDLNSQMPNMYSQEFVKAASILLKREYDCIMPYSNYAYFPLFENDKKFPKLISLVCRYINSGADTEIENKTAKEIAECLSKSVLLYYREDIEDTVTKVYNKEYSEGEIEPPIEEKKNDYKFNGSYDFMTLI